MELDYNRREVKENAREGLRYSQPGAWKVVLLMQLLALVISAAYAVLRYVTLPALAALPPAAVNVLLWAELTLFLLLFYALQFGFMGYCLGTYRGAPTGYWNLFSGFWQIGPVFALRLWVLIFCSLWSLLPILVLTVGLAAVGVTGIARVSQYSVEGALAMGWTPVPDVQYMPGRATALGIAIVAAVFVAALIFWALRVLRYSLAGYVLLDNPNSGARAAVRESKRLMKGRRASLVGLVLSLAGYWLLALLAYCLVYLAAAVLLLALAQPGSAGLAAAYAGTFSQTILQPLLRDGWRALPAILAQLAPFPYQGGPAVAGIAVLAAPGLITLPLYIKAYTYTSVSLAGFYDAGLEKKPPEKPAWTPPQAGGWPPKAPPVTPM